MLKVNCEKLIGEVEALRNDIANNEEMAKNEAIAIRAQRGWSEELINKFAEILVKEEPAFNVDLKQERLNALMQYVDEVEEIVPNVVEEIVEACCCEPQEPVEQPVVADVQYAPIQ